MIKIIVAALILLAGCGVKSDELMAQEEIFNSFICETYKEFDINPNLLPVKYLSSIMTEEDMMKTVGELEKKFSMSGDTLNYASSTWQKFIDEGVLTETELNEMIKRINKYKNGSYLKTIECKEREAKRQFAGTGILTFSEPVFNNDLTKFIITVEIKSSNKMEGLPDMFREIALMAKVNDKWVRIHRIDVD